MNRGVIKNKKYSAGGVFIALLILSLPLIAGAQNREGKIVDSSREVIVKVRAIRASDPYDEASSPAKPTSIEAQLVDLQEKLENLHFRTFRLISSEDYSINLKKKQTIELTDHTTLHLRPVYIENGRVGMWVKWADTSGKQLLLDTRMHFDNDENLVTGTNCRAGRGLILAINVKPK